MLTEKEKEFIRFWDEKRKKSKLNPFFFVKGFALGLIIGLLVITSILLGWYQRADMEANTKLSPIILFVSVLLIALFLAVFYTYFRFEQNEQLYQELKNKENRTKKT